MTEQELIERAIESAKCRIYRVKANEGESHRHQTKVANQVELQLVTIKALEEVQQIRETIKDFTLDCGSIVSDVKEMYRQLNEYLKIGTVEELKEAKEKQIAKKPYVLPINREEDFTYCPNCKTNGILVTPSNVYCTKCGTKLDWGNEDDRD